MRWSVVGGWWLVVSGLLLTTSVLFIDQPLALWINAHQTPETRLIGKWLEEAGKSHWVLGYCLIVAAVAWRSWRSIAHRHIALFTAVAASGILANIIKIIVCRTRPPLLIEKGLATFDLFGFRTEYLWNSFPSGHATTGLAIAIAGSVTWPRLSWLMWLIGISIALGRLMYNVHYLSDVIAGALLGAMVSWWCVENYRHPLISRVDKTSRRHSPEVSSTLD